MSEVTRRLTFSAGHRLPTHLGRCVNPHGHNYVVEVTLSGKVDADGFVMDAAVIKLRLGDWVDKYLDHAFLLFADDVELISVFNAHPAWKVFVMHCPPTAENIAGLILTYACDSLESVGVRVSRVRVYETENFWADAIPGE